jgi:hypothetical protein
LPCEGIVSQAQPVLIVADVDISRNFHFIEGLYVVAFMLFVAMGLQCTVPQVTLGQNRRVVHQSVGHLGLVITDDVFRPLQLISVGHLGLVNSDVSRTPQLIPSPPPHNIIQAVIMGQQKSWHPHELVIRFFVIASA